jgi:hypothetical protein
MMEEGMGKMGDGRWEMGGFRRVSSKSRVGTAHHLCLSPPARLQALLIL